MLVFITGNYKIVKRRDKVTKLYYYDTFYKDRLLFTYRTQKDAISNTKEWISINGRY